MNSLIMQSTLKVRVFRVHVHAGNINCSNEAEPGCAGAVCDEGGEECEDGYCTRNLLQVMNRSDIALRIPLAAQNQRLPSEMLFLRVCE